MEAPSGKLETLSQKQARFTESLAVLVLVAKELGYTVTYGEVYRSPEEAKRQGFPNSLHVDRLAADINLFRDGRYLDTTEAHRPLGELWERFGKDYRWGGRFNDGNHYSIEHNGRK